MSDQHSDKKDASAMTAAEQELWNIINAERFNREHFRDDTEFSDWAQSRCRHTLAGVQSTLPPHDRGALIERVAKALCQYAYPARTLDEAVSPSRQLWMRLIPEAEIAVQAMESARSATVEIDPRMLMLIRVLDDLEESGNGWNPATMPRSANEAERKFRDMLATNWKDIRRLIPIRASDGGVK
jgi:hypothetical protein